MSFSISHILIVISVGLFFTLACSNTPPKENTQASLAGSQATQQVLVAPITQPISVPAEIVRDMALINAEQQGEEGIPVEKEVTDYIPEQRDEKVTSEDLHVESQVEGGEVEFFSEQGGDVKKNSAQVPKQLSKRSLSSATGETISYKVKAGDTFMKIAFEKYGNLYRWKEIFEANRDKVKRYNLLTPGTVLTIENVTYVVIERNGVPYLIRKGDTLSKISHRVYGVTHMWKDLWQNNRQMIKNPNKIYAGFTMYYQEKPQLRRTPTQVNPQ